MKSEQMPDREPSARKKRPTLPVQTQKPEQATGQKASSGKDRPAVPVQNQNQKAEKAPAHKAPPRQHHQVPTAHDAKAKQVRVPDQNAPAKKHHTRQHRSKEEGKQDAKTIDNLYHHLKKVHVQKGYSEDTAQEIAYMESKKVMEKMERIFRHEIKKYEK